MVVNSFITYVTTEKPVYESHKRDDIVLVEGEEKENSMGLCGRKCAARKRVEGWVFMISSSSTKLFAASRLGIWSRPQSLVARVLKSRYHRRSDFLECGLGSRPSFAWRSLLFGRSLLKEGLVCDIGDGRDTNVWRDNRIIDKVPKTPMYRQGSVVDFTLCVSDLLIEWLGRWNVEFVRQTFIAAYAELILKLKPHISRRDAWKWGFTSNGGYTSQSGRRLLGTLQEIQQPQPNGIPPIENNLRKAIWKIRAPPKLKHFLRRVLSGIVPVKERLNSRGLQLDTRSFGLWIDFPSPLLMPVC